MPDFRIPYGTTLRPDPKGRAYEPGDEAALRRDHGASVVNEYVDAGHLVRVDAADAPGEADAKPAARAAAKAESAAIPAPAGKA